MRITISTNFEDSLVGIKLKFTNEMESPLLAVTLQKYKNEISIDVDPSRTIRGIGLLIDETSKIGGIRLYDCKGEFIVDR